MLRRGFLAAVSAIVSGSGAKAGAGSTAPTVPSGEPRDEAWFWRVMSSATGQDQDAKLEALLGTLRTLSPGDVQAFAEAFEARAHQSYRWDLWGACFVIHGGASDDSFYYFRSWLIAEGQERFERALANPDDLADMIARNASDSLELEGVLGSAIMLWEERTGRSFPPGAGGPMEPTGEPFEDDDRWLAARYPKLWDRFGEHPLV